MLTNVIKSVNVFYTTFLLENYCHRDWMCVPEVCGHEIVCAQVSVAPVAAGEEGAADVGGCW